MKTDYTVNDLKERIILEKAVVTVDSELNRVPSYVPMREVYAGMFPVRATEAVSGVAISAQVKYIVVIRKQPLEAKIARVTWNSVHYYPTAPWIETREWMIADFSAEVPDDVA